MAKPAIASLDPRWPYIIFLDIALEQSGPIDVIKSLREEHYIHLGRGSSGAYHQ